MPFALRTRTPLLPAALAFVSFGFVLVRVRVRVRQGGNVCRCWTNHPFENLIPDRIGERVQQIPGGGQRKRCGPSEPRANAAEVKPQEDARFPSARSIVFWATIEFV